MLLLAASLAAAAAAAAAAPPATAGGKQAKPVVRPNLVYVLLDDLDVLLGSEVMLRQTHALVSGRGARFTHFRTHSPKCTPSRTGQLAGLDEGLPSFCLPSCRLYIENPYEINTLQ